MNYQKDLDELQCIQIHLTNNNECIIQAISNKNINDIKLSKTNPINPNNQTNKIKNEDLNLNNLNYLNNIESDDLMNLSITQNDLNSTSQKKIKNKNINNENDENSDNIIINFSELLESINSNDNLNLKTNSIIINKELAKNKLNNFPIFKNYNNINNENTKNSDNMPHDLVCNIKENNYLSYRNSNINSGKKTPLKYIKKQFNNKNENEKEKEKEKINLNKKIINNEDIHGKNLLNNFNYIKGKNNNNNTNDYLMANKNINVILNKELNIIYDSNENKHSNNLNKVLINKVRIGNKNILNSKTKATQKNAISTNDEKKITVNRVNSYKLRNNKNQKVRANLLQNKKIKVTKNLEYNKMQIKISNSNGAKKGGKSKHKNIIKNKSYFSIPTKKINFSENSSTKKKNSNDDTKKKSNTLNGDNLNLNNFLKILKKKININRNKSDSKDNNENNKDSKSIEGSYFNNNYNNNNKNMATDASNRKKSNDDKKNIFIKNKNYKLKNRNGKNIFIKRYPFIQYKYKTIDNNSNSNYNEFNSYNKNKSIFHNNNITLTKNKNSSFNKSLTSRNTSNKKKRKNTSRKISLRTKEFNKFFEIKEIKEKYSEEKSYIPKTERNNDDKITLKKSKSGKYAIKQKENIFNKILKKNKSQFGKTSKNKMINNNKNKIMHIDTETKKYNKNKESRIKNNKYIPKISIEKIIKKNINEFKSEYYNKENYRILGYDNSLTERINTYNRKRNDLNEDESSIPSNNNFNGSGRNAKNNYMNTITYKSTNNINKFFNLIKPKEIIQNFSNYKRKKENN